MKSMLLSKGLVVRATAEGLVKVLSDVYDIVRVIDLINLAVSGISQVEKKDQVSNCMENFLHSLAKRNAVSR